MSARQPVKKYVVLVSGETEGGEKKYFRSIPMTHAAAMSKIAEFKRDGIVASFEAKQRAKERKERKKENDARRLFSEERFDQRFSK